MRRALVVALLLAACSHGTPTPAPAAAPAPSASPAASASAGSAAAPHGRVITQHFHSAALGVDKAYLVYLPAGYDASPTTRYPVFYFLHGLTENETSWIANTHLDQAADALGLRAIVVMPDGDDGFYADSPRAIDYDRCLKDGAGLFMPAAQSRAHTCVRHHAYETYIVHDVVGEVDAHFRTIARRDGRAIAGASMGGFGALELAMRHPDVFAAAASHSGVDALLYAGPHPYVPGKAEIVTDVKAWGASVEPIGAWVRGIFGPDVATWRAYDPASLVEKLRPGQLAIYLDAGSQDDFGLDAEAAYLHDLLAARHIDHAFFIGPGRHAPSFWGPRLAASLPFLRDHVAKPE